MSVYERILSTTLYHSGDEFDAWTIATRLGLSISKTRHACDFLVNKSKLVKKPREGKATVYCRPSYNRWLSKPWTMYHPPCPMPDELTPNTAFIYGNPIYEQHEP